ncbi:calcitonin receptor [Patella vulgata]|uniref:calcitonin receptor n=1 Tax=Patella vulgata TaxID=6465 RepID=UPI0021804208|nr:calcitonin receptor [Patella vulgata]
MNNTTSLSSYDFYKPRPLPSYRINYLEEKRCNESVFTKSYPNDGGVYCNATFDHWLCWDYTPAGSTIYQPCPISFDTGMNPDGFAEKRCMEDGSWLRHPGSGRIWTNYKQCINTEAEHSVMMVYISGYALSIILLIISMIIFACFRQLKCTRVTIHQHLFLSFILAGMFWILYYTLIPMNKENMDNNSAWCIALHIITQFMTICNYFWMFCEGFYLHTLIVIAFTKEKKLLWICTVIGWVLPIVPTVFYLGFRAASEEDNSKCWLNQSSLMWFTLGPGVVSLVINLLFVVNILRILVSKLRAFNSNESHQNRRAVRAVLILIPLLGLQYLAIPFRPDNDPQAMKIFKIFTAFITSYQGVFVALIFCFFNGEVMTVMRRKWNQVWNNYHPTNEGRRRSMCNTTAMTWDESTAVVKNGTGKNSRLKGDSSELQVMVPSQP